MDKYIFHKKQINVTFLKHSHQMSPFSKNIHRTGFLDPRFGGRIVGVGTNVKRNSFPWTTQIVSGNCSQTFSVSFAIIFYFFLFEFFSYVCSYFFIWRNLGF